MLFRSARAKKMLRKMMQQYWAAVLLLLLVPITFFLFRKGDTAVKDGNGGEHQPSPVVAKQKDVPKESQKESVTERPEKPVDCSKATSSESCPDCGYHHG